MERLSYRYTRLCAAFAHHSSKASRLYCTNICLINWPNCSRQTTTIWTALPCKPTQLPTMVDLMSWMLSICLSSSSSSFICSQLLHRDSPQTNENNQTTRETTGTFSSRLGLHLDIVGRVRNRIYHHILRISVALHPRCTEWYDKLQ